MSKSLLSAGVVVLLSLMARADDKPQDDTDLLRGTWHIVRGESDGKPVPAEKIKGTTVVFEKDNLYVQDRNNKKTWAMSYTLDASKKPREITMTITSEGEYKGKSGLGIYALEGKRLKLCYALPGLDRPTTFETKAGSHHNYFILERGKPKAEP
jgi:uncharacterized protein (TIGR03067 family)